MGFYFFITTGCHNTFGRILSVRNALTLKSLDLESSFLTDNYVFRGYKSKFVYQGHRVKDKVTGEKKR